MFYACSAILTVVVLVAWGVYGPRLALALCWAGGLLTPSWMMLPLGPFNCDLRTVGALLAIGIAVVSGKLLFGGWLWIDSCIAALLAAQLATEALGDNLKLGTVVAGCCEWVFPYCLGRVAFQSQRDMHALTMIGAWLCLLLAGWSICESVARVNPVTLLVPHQGSYNAESEHRWGLRRSEGPTTHPIYFGIVQVMLLPWACVAAGEARRTGQAAWRRALPWITLLGVFFTMSRGPQLAAGMAMLIFVYFRFPAWRISLAGAAIAGIMMLVVGFSFFLDALHAWSNEGTQRLTINIKDEFYEYSGTNHRLLQLLVYEDAVRESGWLGYGVPALIAESTPLPLPPGIPGMLRSVDNHYLQLVLRSGYLGLGLFLLAAFLGLRHLIRPALALESSCSLLAAGLFGSMAAVLLMLTTVWLSREIGASLLFGLGLSASLRCYFDLAPSATLPTSWIVARPARGPVGRARLSPGHPVLIPAPPS